MGRPPPDVPAGENPVAVGYVDSRRSRRQRVRAELGVDATTVHGLADGETAVKELSDGSLDCLVIADPLSDGDAGRLVRLATAEDVGVVVFAEDDADLEPGEAYQAGATAYVRADGSDDQYLILANRVREAVASAAADGESDAIDLETLLENVPGVAYRCRNVPGWPMTFVSEGFETLTGYDRAAILSDEVVYGEDVIHPDDRDRVWKTVQRAVDADEPFRVEYRIVTEEGRTKWVWERGRGTTDGASGILEGFITDVSDRHRYREDLQYQKSLLEAQQEATIDGLLTVDDDGRVLSHNRRFAEMWDIPEDVLDSGDDRRLVDWVRSNRLADPSSFQAAVDRDYAEAERTTESELQLADGRVFHRFSTPLAGADGTRYGRLIVFRDITDRKRREGKLEEYRYVIESAISPIAIADLDGTVTSANEAFLDAWGFQDESAVVGRPASAFWADADRAAAVVSQLSETGSWRGEMIAERADGTTFTAQCSASLVTDETGDPISLMSSFVNVSERVARERELDEEREKYKALVENSHDGIAIVQDERYAFVNERFAEIAGHDRSTIQGSTFTDVLHPDDHDRIRDQYARRLDPDRPSPSQSFDVTFLTANGATRIAEISASETVFEGRPADLVLVRDVTQRRERLDQIRKIDRILRHNLNNELNVVTGYGSLITDEAPEPYASHGTRVVEAADRLLDISRKERRITELLAEEPRIHDVDLSPVVRRVVDDVAREYPQVTVETDVPESLFAQATDRIGSAIAEIVENAAEHGDEQTGVEVTGRSVGEEVQVTVADDGPGIPETERRILVGDVEISPLEHGSGMGLWMVYLIVRRSQGALTFAENDPTGSRVTITVPAGEQSAGRSLHR